MNRKLTSMVVAAVVGLQLMAATPARAMSKGAQTFLTFSVYGLIGGTIVGGATFPFAQRWRYVFIGSSVGLYAGIAMGGFLVVNKYQMPSVGESEFGGSSSKSGGFDDQDDDLFPPSKKAPPVDKPLDDYPEEYPDDSYHILKQPGYLADSPGRDGPALQATAMLNPYLVNQKMMPKFYLEFEVASF